MRSLFFGFFLDSAVCVSGGLDAHIPWSSCDGATHHTFGPTPLNETHRAFLVVGKWKKKKEDSSFTTERETPMMSRQAAFSVTVWMRKGSHARPRWLQETQTNKQKKPSQPQNDWINFLFGGGKGGGKGWTEMFKLPPWDTKSKECRSCQTSQNALITPVFSWKKKISKI